MNLVSFIEKLDKAVEDGTVNDDAEIVVLLRNAEFPVEDDNGFDVVAVESVANDAGDIALRVGNGEVSRLTVGDLKRWTDENIEDAKECLVYVPVEGSDGVPVFVPAVATVSNPVLNLFGVMAFYEGYESYLYPM